MLGQGALRQLITVIGFKVNSAEFQQAERSLYMLKQQSSGIAAAGRSAALFLTVPLTMLAKSAIETIAKNERLEMSFTAMIGSAAKAKAFTKELYEYAAKSPLFRMEEVGEVTKQLYAMGGGKIKLTEMIPILQMLGKVSAATGLSMSRLGYDLGITASLGYADWRTIRMFMRGGVPIREPLMKALGIDPNAKDGTEKLLQASRKHLLTYDMVFKALQGLTSGKGIFADIESAWQSSIWGKWQQFTDTIKIMYLSLKDKLLPVLKEVLNTFTGFAQGLAHLNPNTYRFLIILGGFIALIGPLILLKGVLWALLGPFGKFVGYTTALALAVDDIYVWTKGGDSLMGVLFGDYAKYEKTITGLRDAVVVPIQDIGSALRDIFANIGSIMDRVGDLKELNALTLILWSIYTPLKGIADIINTVSLGVNSILAIPRALNPQSKADVEANEDLRKRLGRNPVGAMGAGIGGLLGLGTNFIKNSAMEGWDNDMRRIRSFNRPAYSPLAQSVQVSLAGAGGNKITIPLEFKITSDGKPVVGPMLNAAAAHLTANFHSSEKQ